ncbi:bacillithiol biosynthesis deacetylase BshB1 [Aureivirga sp. CE67]|uniref:bacillithiol biosynthesis deacetylase BshB1 n=1 Tax=Aureivirga sp. CE67 TaxID=1788983 RepID=UPI0018C98FD3|nr:bacillithiol biosynthesis deacetylase BshB1 [Aureivirga sp. CE67]
MKLDILAIGAHPDDVELGCSATIAKEIASGKKVGILDLTRGELGTRGSAEIRDEEAKAAAKVLGLSVRENLGFADGFFEHDNKDHKIEIIKRIRKYQPDIVLLNPSQDRHIDHGKGNKLASAACFLSGLRRIETEHEGVQQEAWRPKQVYHYIQWQPLEPDFVVDVTGFIDKKLEAVLAYKSQFFDPDSKEPSSPISSQNFLESIKYRAQDLGRLVNVDYAEGFITERYIAVKNLSDIF